MAKEIKSDIFLAKQFLYRRAFFIEVLNEIDLLLPISKRVAEIYQEFGVKKEKMKVFPSISAALDFIKPKSLRDTKNYPISFGYIGGINFHKGVHILIEAFRHLPQNKVRLLIFGKGADPTYLKLLNKKVSGLKVEFRKPYSLKQINQVLGEIDVGIIPSIWEEAYGLVGPEFLAAHIPVIGSNIGGIPDYLKDEENGFLVNPNDPEDLAEKMMKVVEVPEIIEELQKRIKKTIDIKEYSHQIKEIYLKQGLSQELKNTIFTRNHIARPDDPSKAH